MNNMLFMHTYHSEMRSDDSKADRSERLDNHTFTGCDE